MALRIIIFTLAAVCTASFISADRFLPHPWLTEDRAARVLKLGCAPPKSPSPPWTSVYDIRVFVCPTAPAHSNCVNQSVVNFTSAMTEPKRGSVLAPIANVIFRVGEWTPMDPPSLTVVMPFTSEQYGDYYCTIEYSNSEGIQKYSAKLRLDESSDRPSFPVSADNFRADIIKAHNVTVTWQPPDNPWEFVEGRVTRTLVDQDGRATSAARSLFMATKSRHVEFDDGEVGVLLTQFRRPSTEANNFSMTVLVESGEHSRLYRYSCSVSYPDCVGPQARFCVCDVVAFPSSALASGDAAAIFFALFLVACIVVVAVLIILMRRNKLPRLKALLNAATIDKGVITDIARTDIETQVQTTQTAVDQPEGQEEEEGATGPMDEEKLVVSLPQDGPSGSKIQNTPPPERDSNRSPTPPASSADDGSIGDLNLQLYKEQAVDKRQKKRSRPHRDREDLSSMGESDEEEAAASAASPLLPQNLPQNTHTSSARTEEKSAPRPSQQQADQTPLKLGNGGAKLEDTHQNVSRTILRPPASASSVNTGGENKTLSLSSPSASRQSEGPHPSRGQERTRRSSQPVGEDVDVTPGNRDSFPQGYHVHATSQLAATVTTSNDTPTQAQPDTGHTHSGSGMEV